MIESPPTVSPQRVTLDLGVEAFDALHEFRGRARVQALAVDDAQLAHLRAGEDPAAADRVASSSNGVRSFAGQHLAGDGDVFAPGVARLDHGVVEVGAVAQAWRA